MQCLCAVQPATWNLQPSLLPDGERREGECAEEQRHALPVPTAPLATAVLALAPAAPPPTRGALHCATTRLRPPTPHRPRGLARLLDHRRIATVTISTESSLLELGARGMGEGGGRAGRSVSRGQAAAGATAAPVVVARGLAARVARLSSRFARERGGLGARRPADGRCSISASLMGPGPFGLLLLSLLASLLLAAGALHPMPSGPYAVWTLRIWHCDLDDDAPPEEPRPPLALYCPGGGRC